jgi:hypothetical protein
VTDSPSFTGPLPHGLGWHEQDRLKCAKPPLRGDDCDALYLLLVVFYEPGMIYKSRNILPAVESGSINQQPDFPMLTDKRIDLRRNLAEVVSLQFIRSSRHTRILLRRSTSHEAPGVCSM